MSIVWWPPANGEHWLHAFSFNEHDKRRPWTILLHGRAFVYLGGRSCFSAEWRWFGSTCSLGIDIGGWGDHQIVAKCGIPGLLVLYVRIDQLLPSSWLPIEPRTTNIRMFDKAIWWNVWNDDSWWSHEKPRWMSGSWHPLDTMFGRMRYEKLPLASERVLIPLPEGNYPATIERYEQRWKRPRGWWVTRRMGAKITPDMPIPEPGKGENSWDCDDTALHSVSTGARNSSEAIARVVEAVLQTRHRHGGEGWMPREGLVSQSEWRGGHMTTEHLTCTIAEDMGL